MLARMARTATSIQAEITTLETYLQSSDSLVSSANSRGTALTRSGRAGIQERLDLLYRQLDRVNGTSPQFVRGFVTGLR